MFATKHTCRATYDDCRATESLCSATKNFSHTIKQLSKLVLLEYCTQPIFCGIDAMTDKYIMMQYTIWIKSPPSQHNVDFVCDLPSLAERCIIIIIIIIVTIIIIVIIIFINIKLWTFHQYHHSAGLLQKNITVIIHSSITKRLWFKEHKTIAVMSYLWFCYETILTWKI